MLNLLQLDCHAGTKILNIFYRSENKDLALLLTGVLGILSTLLPVCSSDPPHRLLVCSCIKLLLNSLNCVMMLADFEGRKEALMGSFEIELENWMKMEYVIDCKTFGIKTPQVETQVNIILTVS